MTVAVVVSTWVGNPPAYVEILCRSLERKRAGAAFDLFLCANGLEYHPPAVTETMFRRVFIRENRGYNLGAWDHAWRNLPGYDRFLFLQDDCRILRHGWLAAFVRRFEETPNCGLVGEHLNRAWDKPWDELEAAQRPEAELQVAGRPVSRARYYREALRRWGVPEGPTARHLTTVAQFTSRGVLGRVGGYRLADTYHEAIAAEIAFSRAVEALGYRAVQVGRRRHAWIGHREWRGGGLGARLRAGASRALGPFLRLS
ncbi:MAG: hypothetical protein SCH98_12245 [Deferrisomatales bacterium]|nr:hypothetical protein [Deferrisomatales bacterium]